VGGMMWQLEVPRDEFFKAGEFLVVAIDPGTKNCAISVSLVKPIDFQNSKGLNIAQFINVDTVSSKKRLNIAPNKSITQTTDGLNIAEFLNVEKANAKTDLILWFDKYNLLFRFLVQPLFTSVLEIDNTLQLYRIMSFIQELVVNHISYLNGRRYLKPILTIERFIYYGRKSIRHLERFNKIIGQLEFASINLFKTLPLVHKYCIEPTILEATYIQWFNTLKPIGFKQCKQVTTKTSVCDKLNKRYSKKQIKDKVLFESLYSFISKVDKKEHLAYGFQEQGDHTFDTFLLTAYAIYRQI
jgi:hypothetical protein